MVSLIDYQAEQAQFNDQYYQLSSESMENVLKNHVFSACGGDETSDFKFDSAKFDGLVTMIKTSKMKSSYFKIYRFRRVVNIILISLKNCFIYSNYLNFSQNPEFQNQEFICKAPMSFILSPNNTVATKPETLSDEHLNKAGYTWGVEKEVICSLPGVNIRTTCCQVYIFVNMLGVTYAIILWALEGAMFRKNVEKLMIMSDFMLKLDEAELQVINKQNNDFQILAYLAYKQLKKNSATRLNFNFCDFALKATEASLRNKFTKNYSKSISDVKKSIFLEQLYYLIFRRMKNEVKDLNF